MSWKPANDFERIQSILQQCAQLEHQWQRKIPGAGDATHTPWMPFNIRGYSVLLMAAVEDAPGPRFLEIGAGIGTKMLIAQQIYGLDVHGIELVPEYAEQAWKLGLSVAVADASEWKNYDDYDIIWFHRIYRDQPPQQALETQVQEAMAPGAVLMGAHLVYPPPSSWFVLEDDWELFRGVWMKPPAA